MDQLDVDFHVLSEDFQKVVALESLGAHPNNPSFRAVSRRWVIGEAPGENFVKGVAAVAGRVTKDAVGGLMGASKSAGSALSSKMMWTFKDWLRERAGSIGTKISDKVDKANRLKRKVRKLQEKIYDLDTLKEHQIATGAWTSKICMEDDVDIEACIDYAERNAKMLEDVSDAYIVFTKAGVKSPKKLDEPSGKLKVMSHSSGWAVKRAAGLLGAVAGTDVKAHAFPGNVVVVIRNYDTKNEIIDFAVARDGNYGPAIPSLSLEQCKQALKAVLSLADSLVERGYTRKGVGYGAITEVANPKGSYFGDDMTSKEVHNITRAIKNSNSIEDALVASQMRVAEGLLVMVEQSAKQK